MAELYTDLEETFDKFFEDGFISKDGFKLKTKSKDFTGEAKLNGGKATLKGKAQFSTHIEDRVIDHKLTFKSNGEHQLENESDISKVVENTHIKTTTDWNSNTQNYEIETSVTNKSVKDTTVRFDFKYSKTDPISVTTHLARKTCPRSNVFADFKYDHGKKDISEAHFGALMVPTDYLKTLISTSLGGINGKNLPWNSGTLAYRQRYVASPSTTLGFDYTYDVEDKESTTK